jgi:hypothetical protein
MGQKKTTRWVKKVISFINLKTRLLIVPFKVQAQVNLSDFLNSVINES